MSETPLLDRVAGAIERHREIRHLCRAEGFPDPDFIAGFLDSDMSPSAVAAMLDEVNAAIARRHAGSPTRPTNPSGNGRHQMH